MKRLWVRLSMVFIGLVVLLIIIPISMSALMRPRWNAAAEQGTVEVDIALERRRTTGVISLGVIYGLASIGAGLALSRSLTRPLDELAEAARAVGAGSLDYRVRPRGSQEFVDVAMAFNKMADELQDALALRRNLVADVAHELRHPLTILQGNLRAMLDDIYPLEKAEVARLYDQTRYLSQVVDDLHELAQAEARQLQLQIGETDLAAIAEAAVVVFEPLALEREITLQRDLPAGLPVRVDTGRLRQVFHNLLSNALRHTPAGGMVTLSIGNPGGEVFLQVQDTGDGLAPEHLPHVFDRFYKVDRARPRSAGGSGLGLAIAKAIIEAHGGRIEAHSGGKGMGARFVAFLPPGGA